jgi:hypothetical protein
MDRISDLSKRLNANLLSVTKRSPSSSGQSPTALTSGGGAPVALSSRFESGAVTSGTTLKLHELFIVTDSKVGASGKTLCYTCIGQKGVFCVRENCGINHRGPGAYTPESGDMHILNKQGEALIQPKINAKDLSDELASEWMGSRESIQDWTTKFGLVNSADHSQTISSEDMEASERFSKFAEDWKTPAKRGRGTVLQPERLLPGVIEDFAFVKNLPEDPAELISQIGWDPSREGRVVRALVNLESALEVSNASNQATFEIVNDELVAGKSTSEILLAKIENIRSRIGAPIKEEGLTVCSPTLWGAIYELSSMISGEGGRPKDDLVFSSQEMEKLQELLDTYYSNQLKPFLRDSLKDYATVAFCETNTGLLLDGADRVNDDLSHLDKRIKILEEAPAVKASRPHLDLQARMQQYKSGPGANVGPPNIDCDPPQPQEDREALAEKVQRLSTQVQKIVAEASDSAISFGGLGLKSVREVDSWLAAHPHAARHYGLCPDVMIFLEWVADDLGGGEKITNQLRKLQKLGFATAAEARAVDSFAYLLPRVFAGEGEDWVHSADKSYFPKCKTFATWSGKGWGYWDRIKASMDRVKTAFEGQVRASIPASDPIYNLFMLAISEVYSWLEGYEKEIITDMCTGLVVNQFSAPAGWSLSTRIGVRVLEEVGQPRIGVGSLISSTNSASNASHVLYAVFRTLDVMSDFKKYKFKNHPCISSEFVKFMASNSGMDSIKKLEDRVKSLESDLKEALNKVKVASVKADTASNKAEQSTKDLVALTKRVKSLE